MHTAESDYVVWCTPQSLTPQWDAHRGVFFLFEYLGKIETEFENTLGCLSGAQMGSNDEKNRRSKNLWHTPFK